MEVSPYQQTINEMQGLLSTPHPSQTRINAKKKNRRKNYDNDDNRRKSTM